MLFMYTGVRKKILGELTGKFKLTIGKSQKGVETQGAWIASICTLEVNRTICMINMLISILEEAEKEIDLGNMLLDNIS